MSNDIFVSPSSSTLLDLCNLRSSLDDHGNNHDIFFANIRSIRQNFDELLEIFEKLNHKFTLIILNETWLGPDENHLFKIDGYESFVTSRNRHGGGVLIFYKNQYHASIIESLSYISPNIESLFINITLNSQALTIGTIYRPPSRSINEFIIELENNILNHLPSNNTVILGDFNIDLLCPPTNSTTAFLTEMQSRGLNNLISNPTRVQHSTSGSISSSTLIDHIWNSSAYVESSFVLAYSLTDHFPIGCVLNIPADQDIKVTKGRKIDKEHITRFQNEFLNFANTKANHSRLH